MAAITEIQPNSRAFWASEIDKAKKRYRPFHDEGHRVVDQYRLQKADGNSVNGKDKFNILFSSTETIRPNLYSKTPTVRSELRHKDRADEAARFAQYLIQNCATYVVKEANFDEVMESVVEDNLLPGLGQAWVSYRPTFGPLKGADDKVVYEDDGKTPKQRVLDENIAFEYIFWEDFLTGVARTWATVPWVAKRCWMTRTEATKLLGGRIAGMLSYVSKERNSRDADNSEDTAEVWEIWDKRSQKVYWFSEGYSEGLLKTEDDPLHLKNFFPCPRPLRAITNTRTFVPSALYSQYKSQAETINDMTRRIRLLQEALKVVGLYDASNESLANILNANSGNRMVPVQNWINYKDGGGIQGAVDWLPLTDVVNALQQLLAARETCKAEIYEITGFSDIVRGMSKASETLGAQNIKANWAGARVKQMQKEVQRFARDMIAIAAELICEHCDEATIAMFGGVQMPTQEEAQADPQGTAQKVKLFKDAVALMKNEGRRLATIDVETDSTLMADEETERADRAQFLSAAGAFLQQAVPAMEAAPELGELLGELLMFTVRSFPSSRPIEDSFERVRKAFANRPPKQEDNGEAAKAQAEQAKQQAEAQKFAVEQQTRQAELAAEQSRTTAELELKKIEEQNRHAEKLQELETKNLLARLEMRKVELAERELQLQETEVGIKAAAQRLAEETAAHDARMDEEEGERDRERVEIERNPPEPPEGPEGPLTPDAD